MKSNIVKIVLLSLFLMIVSVFVILIFGRTYTVYFSLNHHSDYAFRMESSPGKVDILEKRKINDKYMVRVRAKKPGKVFLFLDFDDSTFESILYVHKTMIITDNTYLGKSTASEIIPISLIILLSYLFYLFIQKYWHSVRDNLYQYQNISYLGILIFLAFLIFSNLLSLIHYQGLFETVKHLLNSMSFISLILFPVFFLTFLIVSISNFLLILKEGKKIKNLLGSFFLFFICLLSLFPNFLYYFLMRIQVVDIYNLNSYGPYLYDFIESFINLMIAYLECVFIGTIIIALKCVWKEVKYDKDYIVILGCKIQEDGTLTPLLKGRVDRALEFRNKQLEITGKDLVFIPSGGKGSDETISEAEAITQYLLEHGISKKNILVEKNSKNTYENIRFSMKLISSKRANVCYSTTNYHILRAGLMATEQGFELDGIGSSTKTYFWINAFVREFIGTLYVERKKHFIVFLLILVVIIIMIMITYIVHNI